MDWEPSRALRDLATILADWAHPHTTVYLFGSRVRGDHRPDSDVDVVLEHAFPPSDGLSAWWMAENETLFAAIDAKLPGPLHITEDNEPIAGKVLAAGRLPCTASETSFAFGCRRR